MLGHKIKERHTWDIDMSLEGEGSLSVSTELSSGLSEFDRRRRGNKFHSQCQFESLVLS